MKQIINLNKGNVLTNINIMQILNRARSTWDYARFTLYNKKYITITYNRDRTIGIDTNDRNIGLWVQIQSLRRNVPSQGKISDFIFKYININNK